MWKITRPIFSFALVSAVAACDNSANTKTEVTDRKASVSVPPPDIRHSAELIFKKYSGAWFTVDFPHNFSVNPSLQSATSTEGYDSAMFTSPDGKVQFYIFSPQWSGIATDIAVQSGEKQAVYTTGIENGLTVERWTIKADNGAYFRSYEATSETGGINKIFGIQYSSPEDLENYRSEYLHFKNSLQQYAD